jgi:hypothetical protein
VLIVPQRQLERDYRGTVDEGDGRKERGTQRA